MVVLATVNLLRPRLKAIVWLRPLVALLVLLRALIRARIVALVCLTIRQPRAEMVVVLLTVNLLRPRLRRLVRLQPLVGQLVLLMAQIRARKVAIKCTAVRQPPVFMVALLLTINPLRASVRPLVLLRCLIDLLLLLMGLIQL